MNNEQLWRMLAGECVNGQYHLKKLLGVGSYGAVFQADEVVGDRLVREVAIKIISPDNDEKTRDRQLQELIVAVNLDHPNLIRCFAPGLAQIKGFEFLYLLMELAEETLAKRLEKSSLSLEEVQKIVQEIAAGLVYLHREPHPKVHRDLKPANVLRVGDRWKLSDFGLLRSIDSQGSARTSKGQGTNGYAPPEAYDGVVAPAWDVWSLGVIMVELLTGQLPFTGDTEQELLKKVMEGKPSIEWSKVHQSFREMIKGALEKERQNRWTAEMVLNTFTKKDLPPTTPSIESQPPLQLKSAKGVDYTNLQRLLAAGKWKEADEETSKKMCGVMGRQEEGWLRSEDIDNFPCEDLRTIDQLWVKSSNGHFGFSVQKRIYQSLGGTRNYDEKIWEAFGDRVGWRKNGAWIYYSDLTFSTTSLVGHIPGLPLLCLEGYLPVVLVVSVWIGKEVFWVVSSLASRLVDSSPSQAHSDSDIILL